MIKKILYTYNISTAFVLGCVTILYLFLSFYRAESMADYIFLPIIFGFLYVPFIVWFTVLMLALKYDHVVKKCAQRWGYQESLFTRIYNLITPIDTHSYVSCGMKDIKAMVAENVKYTSLDSYMKEKMTDEMRIHVNRLCVLMCIEQARIQKYTLDNDVLEYLKLNEDEYYLIKCIIARGK